MSNRVSLGFSCWAYSNVCLFIAPLTRWGYPEAITHNIKRDNQGQGNNVNAACVSIGTSQRLIPIPHVLLCNSQDVNITSYTANTTRVVFNLFY